MDDYTRKAIISKCDTYRYELSREWDFTKGYVCFVGLNPSTADDHLDDPTIRRCVNFAKSWGYGGIIMTNLFHYRATNPKDMISKGFGAIPIQGFTSDFADSHIIRSCSRAGLIIACWGTNGNTFNRDLYVKKTLKENNIKLHYLKLTKEGFPSHPLYLKKDLKPQLWNY